MSTTAVRSVTYFPTTYGAYRCVVVWHGVEVEVDHMDQPYDPALSRVDVLHHFGEPTGDLFCAWCYGVADAPGVQADGE